MENTEAQVSVPNNDNAPEQQVENTPELVSAENNDETGAPAEPKVEDTDESLPHGVQKRLGTLTRRNKEYEARLEQSNYEVAQLRQAMDEFIQSTKKPIVKEDFANDAAYIQHVTEEKVRSEYAKQVTIPQQMHAQAIDAQQRALSAWNDKVAETFEDVNDFAAVVSKADVQMSGAVVNSIMESEEGPKIAYYLAQNRGEADRIASLSGKTLDRAILKLEIKLEGQTLQNKSASAAKPITNAPAPIGRPSSNTVKHTPDAVSTADFIAQRRAHLYGKK